MISNKISQLQNDTNQSKNSSKKRTWERETMLSSFTTTRNSLMSNRSKGCSMTWELVSLVVVCALNFIPVHFAVSVGYFAVWVERVGLVRVYGYGAKLREKKSVQDRLDSLLNELGILIFYQQNMRMYGQHKHQNVGCIDDQSDRRVQNVKV